MSHLNQPELAIGIDKKIMKKVFSLFALLLLLASCGKEEKTKPTPDEQELPQITETTTKQVTPPAPKVRLRAYNFKDLPNWNKDNLEEALSGFKYSCLKILKENTTYMSNSKLRIPTMAYQIACQKLIAQDITTGVEFKYFLESNFLPFLVIADDSDQGKFTSYYEAAINASPIQTSLYQYPIYGKPLDLVEFNPHDFDPSLPNKRLLGRVKEQKLVPYYTREEIEQNKIAAPVILWGDSNVDINIMQIQGSAVATLPDGRQVRLSYADNNGHPFKGIGSILLEKGYIKPGEASMGNIKKWLKNNPQIAQKEMRENKRFIFHRISQADGPIGAQGVPLHAGRSIAVDREYIPLGALMWLETTGPDNEKIEKLVIAQDIGSAIKGPIRGDYFWGSGKDDILEKAGKMNSSGRYFILIPQNEGNRP